MCFCCFSQECRVLWNNLFPCHVVSHFQSLWTRMNEMNYKSKAPNFKNDHKIQTTDLLTNNLNSSSISIVFSLVQFCVCWHLDVNQGKKTWQFCLMSDQLCVVCLLQWHFFNYNFYLRRLKKQQRVSTTFCTDPTLASHLEIYICDAAAAKR